ncbi:MAG: hypothetical protein K9H26_19105 [Prolixibacteraceae bacterium]|nr:hypothetical protein [Prolixibacteraceae bacterium]
MNRIIFFLSIFILTFLFGCENSIDEVADYKPMHQTEELTVSENGFLIFKDQECYNRISNALDKMTDDEFIAWENKIGFVSAQTFLNNVYLEVEELENLSQFEDLKQKYSDKLVLQMIWKSNFHFMRLLGVNF